MKTYLPILLIFVLYFTPTFSQESQSDEDLTQCVIGTWEHVVSTDPDGNVQTYDRKIELFADGTGICTKLIDGEEVQMPFYWDIVDGAIMLYIVDNKGRRINTDSQLISDVDARQLNLASVWESDDYGMASLYERKTNIVAEY